MTLNPAKDMQPNFSGPKGTDECQVCAGWIHKSQFSLPPTNHTCIVEGKKVENRRACKTCWEAHLSREIEVKRHDEVECMFCPGLLGRKEFKELGARDDTLHRYSQKQTDSTKHKCQARCQGIYTTLQNFNRETDGRIFTCKNCNFQTCVDCDRPEHVGETCDQYKARIHASNTGHAAAEAKSFAEYVSCPRCKTLVEIEKKCGYVQCAPGNEMSNEFVTGGCGFRFCSHCLINWVGDDSAYLGGKKQHGITTNGKRKGLPCKYVTRPTASAHGLKHRFESEDEGEDDEQPASKKQKTAKGKKSKATKG